MFSRFFHNFTGSRCLPKKYTDCVEVLSWYNPHYNPSQHMALNIRTAHATHYISFHPDSLVGLSKRPFMKLSSGINGSFMTSYEDETLAEGFRNAWPLYENLLTVEQKKFVAELSIKKITNLQILGILKSSSFPLAEHRARLQSLGQPSEKIELRTLDISAMLRKIYEMQNQDPKTKWAGWSGTCKHQDNTHNCASIILELLYAGGMGRMFSSTHDLLGVAGMLLGVVYGCTQDSSFLEVLKDLVIGLIFGRGLGAAYEGYEGIQPFLNLTSSQGKDNLGVVWGLRLASTLFSTLVGIIKPGPIVPAFLTLPRDVLNLAHSAKCNEETQTVFRTSHEEEDRVEEGYEYQSLKSSV